MPSTPPSLQELSRRGVTGILVPWVLDMVAAAESPPSNVSVFFHCPNWPTSLKALVEGPRNIESLLRQISHKGAPPPATRASIESLLSVQISEAGLECAICLTEYELNDDVLQVREMPCGHRFHCYCIQEWLRKRGWCPICRFQMPAEKRKQGVSWIIDMYSTEEGADWNTSILEFV